MVLHSAISAGFLMGLLWTSLTLGASASGGQPPTHTFERREQPRIESVNGLFEITDGEKDQVTAALRDVLELVKPVVTRPKNVVEPVFRKYFEEGDWDKVNGEPSSTACYSFERTMARICRYIENNTDDNDDDDETGVFKNIYGHDGAGGDALKQLTIEPGEGIFDDDSDSSVVCEEPGDDGNVHRADIDLRNQSHPLLYICPLGFDEGSLSAVPGGPAQVKCDTIGHRVSENMTTLASILLHEYTQFKPLVSPPLGNSTQDLQDNAGPFSARRMKNKAVENAESYVWFANELYWSETCRTQFEDPNGQDDMVVQSSTSSQVAPAPATTAPFVTSTKANPTVATSR